MYSAWSHHRCRRRCRPPAQGKAQQCLRTAVELQTGNPSHAGCQRFLIHRKQAATAGGALLCMLAAAVYVRFGQIQTQRINWKQAGEPRTGSRMTSIVSGHSKLSATSLRAIAAGALAGSSAAGLGVGTWRGSGPAGCFGSCAGGCCCCCECCCCRCCCCGTTSGGDGCRGCGCGCLGSGWLAGVGACAGGGGWGCDAAEACPASHRTRSTCFLLLLCVCKDAESRRQASSESGTHR
jgi:hypothetical protein